VRDELRPALLAQCGTGSGKRSSPLERRRLRGDSSPSVGTETHTRNAQLNLITLCHRHGRRFRLIEVRGCLPPVALADFPAVDIGAVKATQIAGTGFRGRNLDQAVMSRNVQMFRLQGKRDRAVARSADGAVRRLLEDELLARERPPRNDECNGRNHVCLLSIRCVVRSPVSPAANAVPMAASRVSEKTVVHALNPPHGGSSREGAAHQRRECSIAWRATLPEWGGEQRNKRGRLRGRKP
jgi:hypothetical protein